VALNPGAPPLDLMAPIALDQRDLQPGPGSPRSAEPMTGRDPWPVVLLPGVVLPAQLAYGALLATLGHEVDARPKELETAFGLDQLAKTA
jgi:hypothetical protein